MRHKKRARKLHRKRDQRKALMKTLSENLILMGKIKTTEAKAKELRSFIEKKITKAKKQDFLAYRFLRKYLSPVVCKKLIKEIIPSLKSKKGGYTKITKIGKRKKDNAKMVIIEIIK